MRSNIYLIFSMAFSLLLMSCSTVTDVFSDKDDDPLPGERISVLELQKDLEPDNDVLDAQGLIVPSSWQNEFWPQAGGYPNHSMQHLSLSPDMVKPIWKASIGKGASKALPLTAQPIVVDGKVYTLDSRSLLSAFSIKDGKKIWSNKMGHEEEEPVISGGVSYSRGQLYVTNGFNQVLAVNPANGNINWRVEVPAPSRAAPTIMDDRVFVSLLDNRVIALNGEDGALLWEFSGLSEVTGLIGSASPAASREIVVPVFSSGEVFALRVENGALAWSENLSSLRRFAGLSALSDIRGLPVIDKGLVIVISFSGRMIAIDERTGRRLWQREVGGSETPWIAGNHVFVVSSDNELVALGRDTGTISWVLPLVKYEDPEDKENPIIWSGPILAGNRLIVVGSDGKVVDVAPEDGTIIRGWTTNRDINIAPVVAGDTLYLLANDGTLMAYK
jgi:outer membrane protein assembly factor BamB